MNDRVLAYKMAQSLTMDELTQVSGALGRQTSYTTLKGSGDSGGTLDTGIDFTYDF